MDDHAFQHRTLIIWRESMEAKRHGRNIRKQTIGLSAINTAIRLQAVRLQSLVHETTSERGARLPLRLPVIRLV